MSNTKVDPWALLREARELHEMPFADPETSAASFRELDARIDAALAAHEAEERVEVKWIPNGPIGFSGYLKNRVEKVLVYATKDGSWWASATNIGPFDTLDEAQRVALAAARGMR